jgi:peptidase E
MSTIDIFDLKPSGLDLFSDTENYLDDLSDSEFIGVTGGSTPVCLSTPIRASISSSSYHCYASPLCIDRV